LAVEEAALRTLRVEFEEAALEHQSAQNTCLAERGAAELSWHEQDAALARSMAVEKQLREELQEQDAIVKLKELDSIACKEKLGEQLAVEEAALRTLRVEFEEAALEHERAQYTCLAERGAAELSWQEQDAALARSMAAEKQLREELQEQATFVRPESLEKVLLDKEQLGEQLGVEEVAVRTLRVELEEASPPKLPKHSATADTPNEAEEAFTAVAQAFAANRTLQDPQRDDFACEVVVHGGQANRLGRSFVDVEQSSPALLSPLPSPHLPSPDNGLSEADADSETWSKSFRFGDGEWSSSVEMSPHGILDTSEHGSGVSCTESQRRIAYLEEQCRVMKKKLDMRPVVFESENEDALLMLESEDGLGRQIGSQTHWEWWFTVVAQHLRLPRECEHRFSKAMVPFCHLVQPIRRFTLQLLRKESWLLLFYLHIFMLYVLVVVLYTKAQQLSLEGCQGGLMPLGNEANGPL